MTRIALLVVVLAAGCSNTKPEERKLAGSSAPVPTAPAAGSAAQGSAAAPGSAAAGSAAQGGSAEAPKMNAAKTTGFAPFDDGLAGTKPWLAAGDKEGVVELYVKEDLSGQTKGRFTVERLCGDAAAKAIDAQAKQMAERTKARDLDPVACKEIDGAMSCFQAGAGEGDLGLELQFAKRGDAWRPVGVLTYGMGMSFDKQKKRYDELLKQPCK